MSGLDQLLADRISRFGSIRFDEFVDLALNAPEGGFFSAGGRAGRRDGDFITSPEVGPLFGAVLARYLDARWEDLEFPDPFVVVDAGAGRGALALSVLAASPRCAPALRYVLVESSPALREAQAEHLALVHPFEVLGPDGDPDADLPAPGSGSGPVCCSLEDLPAQAVPGVVVANELLDNLPFRLVQRGVDGWDEVRVGLDAGRLVELLVPADEATSVRLEALAPDAPVGGRIPLQDAAGEWLRSALGALRQGSVVVIDYASPTSSALAERPLDDWLRTYRDHERGDGPLEGPGTQDVTCEVAVDQLIAAVGAPVDDRTQADWLRHWGIDRLVDEGRRVWEERAGVGDLEALRARSRAVEAEALTDPTGLGAFRVLDWHVD
jgi:SAM-dependent MidA family methyltransferase